MNKERFKGIVIGIILCVTLYAGMLAVSAQTVMQELTYGVKVSVNGRPMELADDSQPFVMGGRTFLPIRALAEALSLTVDFDAGTNTVLIAGDGVPELAIQGGPLTKVAMYTEKDPDVPDDNRGHNIWVSDRAVMNGETYFDILNFRRGSGAAIQYTTHRLNRQYNIFSGNVGWVGGSTSHIRSNVTFNIIGDGRLITSLDVYHESPVVPFSVDVRGIQELKLEMVFPAGGSTGGVTHACHFGVSSNLE